MGYLHWMLIWGKLCSNDRNYCETMLTWNKIIWVVNTNNNALCNTGMNQSSQNINKRITAWKIYDVWDKMSVYRMYANKEPYGD